MTDEVNEIRSGPGTGGGAGKKDEISQILDGKKEETLPPSLSSD